MLFVGERGEGEGGGGFRLACTRTPLLPRPTHSDLELINLDLGEVPPTLLAVKSHSQSATGYSADVSFSFANGANARVRGRVANTPVPVEFVLREVHLSGVLRLNFTDFTGAPPFFGAVEVSVGEWGSPAATAHRCLPSLPVPFPQSTCPRSPSHWTSPPRAWRA